MRDRFIYHYRRTRSLLQRGLRSLRVRGVKASLAMLSPRLKKPGANPELWFPGSAEIGALATADFSCSKPQVSLIIPVHNKLELTKSCLASVFRQGGAKSFEVIVVDDASSDGSFGFLSSIQGLRVVRMPQQSGYVFASNEGARHAQGEMLVFLNNDTIVQAGWLDALLSVFEDFPNTGIAGAKLLYPNGLLQEAGGAIFNDGSVWNIGRFEQAGDTRFNHVREIDYVSGAALAIHKNLFDKLGGFDPHFAPGYFEDTDLAMRVKAGGYKIRYQAFSRVVHLEGATSGTRLDSGMKAFQIPHQEKFRQRWQTELDRYPPRPVTRQQNAAMPFASQRKKILVLDEHVPRSNADSGSLRLFHLMQIMARQDCDIHFVAADLGFDAEHTPLLQRAGIACHYRPWCRSFYDWLANNASHFDLIIVCRVDLMDSLYTTLRQTAPKAALIFDTVDLHHIREARQAELSKSETMRRQAETTKQREYALIEKCDETWVVSETERSSLRKAFPSKTIRCISNIHDIRPTTPGFHERRDILFVGNFRHAPNEDGLRWFVEKVWPRVLGERSGIVLHVVGASPPESLGGVANGIVFHGHVDDIEKCIDGARINIAPLRYGAGAKGKISQALASGLPSIATSVAAEGMHLQHAHSVMIADEPELFARSILALHEDEALWNSLSKNGRAIAEKHFSGRAITQEILPALHGTTDRDSGASTKTLVAHYLWNFKSTEEIPIPAACLESNKKFFGQTRVVNVADVESLLGRYPALEKLWGRIPNWIVKVDLGRLLYIYFNGGFYLDIDCRVENEIPVDGGRRMILFTETILKSVNKLGPRECKNPENALRVANYAFGSTIVEHPFLDEVIRECIERLAFLLDSQSGPFSQTDVLWVCGPDVITTIYHKSRHAYPNLVLLDTSFLSHLAHGSWRD